MSLPKYVNQVLAKVYDDLNTALRVNLVAGIVSGSFQPDGLGTAALDEFDLDDTTWEEATLGLSPRVNIAIQNISADPSAIVLWNYTGTGTKGWRIPNLGSKSVQILNSATSKVYVKMLSGTGRVVIEELGPSP